MRRHVAADPSSLDGTFMTEEEYLALPETMLRMELVDGLVVCEPSATFDHQSISGALFMALRGWAATRSPKPTVLAAPLDVRFGPSRILQPDIVLYLEPLVRPVAMPVSRIPDLCAEIVSTRVERDRTTRRMIYGAAGVKELWTVLADGRVERWWGAGLDSREEYRGMLTSPLLPSFTLDVPSLFEA